MSWDSKIQDPADPVSNRSRIKIHRHHGSRWHLLVRMAMHYRGSLWLRISISSVHTDNSEKPLLDPYLPLRIFTKTNTTWLRNLRSSNHTTISLPIFAFSFYYTISATLIPSHQTLDPISYKLYGFLGVVGVVNPRLRFWQYTLEVAKVVGRFSPLLWIPKRKALFESVLNI